MSSKYAYSLQTVPYEVSIEEQRAAQLAMWRMTNKIQIKTWIILVAITILAIVGLIFIQNYSKAICWVMLVGVVVFLIARTVGYEWYVKRKMNEFPAQEIKGIKLGVQPVGLVMQQQMGMQQGTANIAWKDVTEWYDTAEFLLVSFTMKGQQGSFFLPKRMNSNNFPFATIRKHLNETVGSPKSM